MKKSWVTLKNDWFEGSMWRLEIALHWIGGDFYTIECLKYDYEQPDMHFISFVKGKENAFARFDEEIEKLFA